MARSWLIDSRGIASKVKNASLPSAYQIKDSGANRECPSCHYLIDNSDVAYEWPGLPAGVKFDPSDIDLLEHLAAKCGVGNAKPHLFIDEFIPTLEEGEGICYTHPENLPGAKKDGSSVHFFHRSINAYATGQRKRRKIHSQHTSIAERVRWHKTGKTKPVIENGAHKGFKKIMVLYKSSKNSKPDKSSWVMHQYHLGTEEDEKSCEYVVSKIFYQQKQTDKTDDCPINDDSDIMTLGNSPRTPIISNLPRPGKSILNEDVTEDKVTYSSAHETEIMPEASSALQSVQLDDDNRYPTWLAGETQAIESPNLNSTDDTLLCKEIFNSCGPFSGSGINNASSSNLTRNTNDEIRDEPCGIAELENLEFDTPPDFNLADLQFGSQDSVFDWLDRL